MVVAKKKERISRVVLKILIKRRQSLSLFLFLSLSLSLSLLSSRATFFSLCACVRLWRVILLLLSFFHYHCYRDVFAAVDGIGQDACFQEATGNYGRKNASCLCDANRASFKWLPFLQCEVWRFKCCLAWVWNGNVPFDWNSLHQWDPIECHNCPCPLAANSRFAENWPIFSRVFKCVKAHL